MSHFYDIDSGRKRVLCVSTYNRLMPRAFYAAKALEKAFNFHAMGGCPAKNFTGTGKCGAMVASVASHVLKDAQEVVCLDTPHAMLVWEFISTYAPDKKAFPSLTSR